MLITLRRGMEMGFRCLYIIICVMFSYIPRYVCVMVDYILYKN